MPPSRPLTNGSRWLAKREIAVGRPRRYGEIVPELAVAKPEPVVVPANASVPERAVDRAVDRDEQVNLVAKARQRGHR